MTRTEDELRTLLHTPGDPAASARVLARVVAAPRSAERAGRRRLRIGLVTAAALVVVLGAALAVVTARPGHRTAPRPPVASTQAPPTPAPSTPAPSTPARVLLLVPLPSDQVFLQLAPDSGYGLDRLEVGGFATGQQFTATFARDDGTVVDVAEVAVDGPGQALPALPGPGRPSIDLGHGVVARWVVVQTGLPADDPHALRWTLAGGVTVTVTPSAAGIADAQVVAVAKAVRIVPPTPARIPVSVSAWPAGWSLSGVRYLGVPTAASPPAADDVQVIVATPGLAASYGQVTGALIDVAGSVYGARFDLSGTPVVVGGRTWHWNPARGTLSWRGDDRVIRLGDSRTLGQLGASAVGEDDLVTVAAHLTLASSFDDRSTWFDATTAFSS